MAPPAIARGMRPRGVAMAMLLAMLPVAAAQHPPLLGEVLGGVVLTDEGPRRAVLEVRWWCESPVRVAVTVQAPGGPARDEFEADLAMLAPPGEPCGWPYEHCLPAPVSPLCLYDPFGPPAGAFRLTNATIGVELAGHWENAAHFAVLLSLEGAYRGQLAAFFRAYA